MMLLMMMMMSWVVGLFVEILTRMVELNSMVVVVVVVVVVDFHRDKRRALELWDQRRMWLRRLRPRLRLLLLVGLDDDDVAVVVVAVVLCDDGFLDGQDVTGDDDVD